MNIAENIKKYIKTISLEDFNDIEIMLNEYCLKDSIQICRMLKDRYDIIINPLHAYWLWVEYSSSYFAQWLTINVDLFEHMLEYYSRKFVVECDT